MIVSQTSNFKKQVKKLHPNQKRELDIAIGNIVEDPSQADMKTGNLAGIRVYKFSMINQLTLVAYEYCSEENQIILHALGSHENFYRDLKNK